MLKQPGVSTGQLSQKEAGLCLAVLKALELAHGPIPELPVNVGSQNVQGRTTESPIVGNPPTKERIDLLSDVSQSHRRQSQHVQAPDRFSHRLHRRWADRRRVATKERTVSRVTDLPRAELIPKEVKHNIRVFPFAPIVFAINDLGFGRMHLKSTFCQSSTKLRLEGLGLLFAPTVDKSIVGVPTPWKIRMCPRHPQIKRIMHEEVGEAGANDTALWRAACPL